MKSERDSRDAGLAFPGGSVEVQMDEIEHVRYLLEERNRDFESLTDIPRHDLLKPEWLGREPGLTLGKIAALRLEIAGRRPGSDTREALEDVAGIAIKSMDGPLTEADIWRLCYRLAYLVGDGIHVARDARKAIEEDRTRVARHAGKNRHKNLAPIRQYAHGLLPDICYADDGKGERLLQKITVDALKAKLERRFPSGDIPKWETLQGWLKVWCHELGYTDWRHLPKSLDGWRPALLAKARKPPRKGVSA